MFEYSVVLEYPVVLVYPVVLEYMVVFPNFSHQYCGVLTFPELKPLSMLNIKLCYLVRKRVAWGAQLVPL